MVVLSYRDMLMVIPMQSHLIFLNLVAKFSRVPIVSSVHPCCFKEKINQKYYNWPSSVG